MTSCHLWKKTVVPGQLDAWLRRVGPFVPPERLAVVVPVNGRRQNLQAYLETEQEARALAERFGGRTSHVSASDWLPAPATAPGKPLAFGRHLLVSAHPEELVRLRAAHPRRGVLCIPAAMAFGTGEHATTAMCLRFLSEVSVRLRTGAPWTVLDLGTGSGVLALAGKLFGAASALGYDNDPHAVRTARENAALNGIKGVTFRRIDLLRQVWPSAQPDGWPFVTANLFSELLISLLPRIVSEMQAGGQLIASGILGTQAAEVEQALTTNGLEIIEKRRRGRWVAYLIRKRD